MHQPYMVILAATVLIVCTLIAMVGFLSRYTKVGPNQVLIVSGQKRHLPDGSVIGFRIVKGGGTFVLPVIERVDILSLEVITVDLPRVKAQAAGGRVVEADGSAQVKINSDDASIAAAAEHFLSKSPTEIKNTVRPVLEIHLNSVLGNSTAEEAMQNPAACAARVQTAAAGDLGRMGVGMISFTIRNARAA